jgi:hypothetical protein
MTGDRNRKSSRLVDSSCDGGREFIMTKSQKDCVAYRLHVSSLLWEGVRLPPNNAYLDSSSQVNRRRTKR